MDISNDVTKRLDGKIAVVTGGNSGIGLATSQQFVEEGAYVFIAGRRQNELDKAVKQIGKNVTDVQSDVSNLANLDRRTPTDIRYEYMHIDMTNILLNLFAKLISFTCFCQFSHIVTHSKDGCWKEGA